jgi:hypothetical protein
MECTIKSLEASRDIFKSKKKQTYKVWSNKENNNSTILVGKKCKAENKTKQEKHVN